MRQTCQKSLQITVEARVRVGVEVGFFTFLLRPMPNIYFDPHQDRLSTSYFIGFLPATLSVLYLLLYRLSTFYSIGSQPFTLLVLYLFFYRFSTCYSIGSQPFTLSVLYLLL